MNLTNKVVFPGTFNPIHNGHLQMAETAKQTLGTEKVMFIPAYSPYHKNNTSNATSLDRLKMTRLAVKGNLDFEVNDIDFQLKPEHSYSLNTVRKLLGIDGNPITQVTEKVNFLIGADTFRNLDTWHKIRELAELVKFLVVRRPGSKPVSEIRQALKTDNIQFQEIQFNEEIPGISSTLVRERVNQGKDIDKLVPKAVADYIDKHKLYVNA